MSGMNGWLDPKWVFKIEPREGYGLNMVGMRVEHYDALAVRLAEAERVIALQWGLPKPCGHDFHCICADDAAKAFLRPTGSADVARPEPCNHGKRQPDCPNCQAEIAALTVTGEP